MAFEMDKDNCDNIFGSIKNYEDKAFLEKLWTNKECQNWFFTFQNTNDTFEWEDAQKLGKFIKKNPLRDILDKERHESWPRLLQLYLEWIVTTIRSMHNVVKGEPIGEGGFGQVFHGTGYSYNEKKELALKRCTSDANFDREHEMLQKVEGHRFIVRYLGAVKIDGRYMAMEICDGSLRDYVQMPNNKPDSDRAVLGQVVVALQYLHSKGIIHKDLNPNNILFKKIKNCQVVHVKVADFGISKQKKWNQSHFSKTENMGTCGYKAPELLKTGEPSFESDVWALGAVVYFLVSKGDHPYRTTELVFHLTVDSVVMDLKTSPKIGQLDYWAAADLVFRLMQSEKKDRPDIFLLLLHPFFSKENESASTNLAIKINDFYVSNRENEYGTRFKEQFNESNVRNWCAQLGTNWKTSENEVESRASTWLKFFSPLKESDTPTKMKTEIASELNFSGIIEAVDEPIIGDVKKLLKQGPKLFSFFLWHSLTQLKLPMTHSERFMVSELEFSLFYCPLDFYKHLVGIENREPLLVANEVRRAAFIGNSDAMEHVLSLTNRLQTEVPGIFNYALGIAASWNSNPKVVELLIGAGADVNEANERDMTALHLAAANNSSPRIIEALIEAKADVNALVNKNWTALHLAAANNWNPEIVKVLIQNGKADVSTTNDRKVTPLHLAASNNPTPEIVEELIGAKADVNALMEKNWTPLHLAAANNSSARIVELLINAHAKVEAMSSKNMTPLHLAAAYNSNLEIIEALISKGANVSALMEKGWTPLHLAAESNCNPGILIKLIDAGASVKVVSDDRLTPLHLAAAYNSNVEIVKLLIDKGSDVNALMETNWTPLHQAAARNPNAAIVKLLIDSDANVNLASDHNSTALLLAAEKNPNADIVRMLLDARADVKQCDNDGDNALHCAVSHNPKPEIIQLLLAKGVDPLAENKRGQTPLDLAREPTKSDILKIIQDYILQN